MSRALFWVAQPNKKIKIIFLLTVEMATILACTFFSNFFFKIFFQNSFSKLKKKNFQNFFRIFFFQNFFIEIEKKKFFQNFYFTIIAHLIFNLIVRQLIKTNQFRTRHCTHTNTTFSNEIRRKV